MAVDADEGGVGCGGEVFEGGIGLQSADLSSRWMHWQDRPGKAHFAALFYDVFGPAGAENGNAFWTQEAFEAGHGKALREPLPLVGRGRGGGGPAHCGSTFAAAAGGEKRQTSVGCAPPPLTPPHKGEGDRPRALTRRAPVEIPANRYVCASNPSPPKAAPTFQFHPHSPQPHQHPSASAHKCQSKPARTSHNDHPP